MATTVLVLGVAEIVRRFALENTPCLYGVFSSGQLVRISGANKSPTKRFLRDLIS
jgi:hypothetical protein